MKLYKIKNILLVTLAMALVAAASVAITYAATTMNKEFGSADNVFTTGSIATELSEVKWDRTKGLNDTDDDVPTSGTEGQEVAKSYRANQTIPKNPKMSNTNADGGKSEWVAIKVSYTATIVPAAGGSNVDVTYSTRTKFENALAKLFYNGSAGYNSDKWESNTDGTVFYYKTELVAQRSTEVLFDSVKINDLTPTSGQYSILDNSGNGVATKALPEFHIQLTGYAVDATDITTFAAAQAALDALMS